MSTKNHFTIKHITKQQRYYRYFATGLGAFILAYASASLLAPVGTSSAEEQEFSASIANALSGVSVTAADASINVDVGQPTATGKVVKAESSLTAQTAAASGYQLYISTDSNAAGGNRLYLGGDTSAAYISPNHDNTGADIAFGSETTLNTNSWGFTVDDTKYENSEFAAVPIMGEEALIKSTSAAGEDEIPIYFGVNVNTNMSTGTYSGSIVYTIIAEDTESDNYSTPSITDSKGIPYMATTITLPLRASVGTISELGTINAKVGNTNCLNQSATLNNASISINCTLPVLSAGAKDVSVTVQQYGETYSTQSAFTYITNMQEMTTEMCDKIASSYVDISFTLKDSRDTKTYKIIKHKDGNCWMNQNLALDGGRTLHTTDSNVNEDRALTANSSNGVTNSSTTVQIFSNIATSYTSSCDSSYPYCVTSTEPYGNLYNWVAATAGLGAGSSTVVTESVCPSAGNNETWRLPDYGTTSGLKSYSNLLSAYGLPTTVVNNGSAVQTIQRPPLSFPIAGQYFSNRITEYGKIGDYWSRTVTTRGGIYTLLFRTENGSGWFSPQDSYGKDRGFSIRCVLGE